VNGGPGADTLYGRRGNDTLNTEDGVSGNDAAHGGPGRDTCTTDPGDTVTSCP
jgi:Ca2+-binding RTX toxin-like protein